MHLTVDALRAKGAGQALTPLDALARVEDGLYPTGFIFHISRCGSTLVSQMVATHQRATVVSESFAINAVLEMEEVPEVERIRLLQQVVGALGRRPAGCETHYVIKFTSWNVLHVHLIKRAFPDVPCLFIYRDPIEVLVSLAQDTPAWGVTLGALGNDVSVAKQIQSVRHAQALQALMHCTLNGASATDIVLEYTYLPECIPDLIGRYWGISLTALDTVRMLERARYHARGGKQHRIFVPDTARKQEEASAEIRRADRAYTRALYRELVSHPQAYHMLNR